MRRLAYTVVTVVAILGVLALFGRGGDDDGDSVAAPTPTPAAATPAAPTATPTGAPPTPTPGAATATLTSTPSPSPSPTPVTQTPTPTPTPDRMLPPSLEQIAAALPGPGVTLTDAYDPVCPGAAVEPVVFAGPDFEDGDRYAVWVLWPYPDRAAFWEQWVINAERRAEPLLDGCEPPNGFIYFNQGLLIWFVGFYGSEVEPGSPPDTRAEIREHPVIRAFLELRR